MTDPADLAVAGTLLGLAAQVSGLTDALAEHATADLYGSAIVAIAVETVPGARFADLSEWRDGHLTVLAANRGYPDPLDTVRDDTGEGPCFEALKHDAPALGSDLADDPRWPQYGPRVVQQTGVRSALSYRLRLPGGRPGVLSLYSDWPYGFDDLGVATGAMLASCCSLAGLAAEPGSLTVPDAA